MAPARSVVDQLDLICRLHAFMQRAALLHPTCIPRRLAQRRRFVPMVVSFRTWTKPTKQSDREKFFEQFGWTGPNETRAEGIAMAVILSISARLRLVTKR